jgi:hypothetical protein
MFSITNFLFKISSMRLGALCLKISQSLYSLTVLRAKKRASTPSIVFILGLAVESIKKT